MSHPSPHASSSEQERRRRRNPAPAILLAVAALLAAYYVVVGVSGVLQTTTTVPLHGSQTPGGDYVTLAMRTEDVDLTNRVIQASVLPSPHGALVGEKAGEISQSLRIEVLSGGLTSSVVTVPGESVVDPTAVSLSLDRGDAAYPFDEPFTDFQISVTNDTTGENVPFEVVMENSARPWVLSGEVSPPQLQGGKAVSSLTLEGARDPLSVVLVLFYVLAILLTTLMAVVTVGTALVKKELEFSNVIWLSATMLSFPALRSAMPGAPPIGTALDYIVFFPCMCLIALLLVWTGFHLLWRESALLRRRHLDEDETHQQQEAGQQQEEAVAAATGGR
ncbi:DUF4436 domain-containing protein [Auraticoccus sp. F435]|uniref:DUF4436 domain-containing protein n=1 Tax=Auraticoccus cholistanensis TaxID=2656650 RepID=A0A6A9US62_9ACTN|nr:DUF4436 family protein [Auraticoccus cholistanensis]MVA74555.1 DUF4436 domain-containing protein [Auraticoccus cholistanensis]